LLLRGKLFGVTDFFAILGLPQRAWLDPEEIKNHHHRLIATAHPDKPGGTLPEATALNEARRVLESHSLRLRHLIELQQPGFSSDQNTPSDWELVSSTGEATREAYALSQQLSQTTSPILRAPLQVRAKTSEHRLAALKALLLEHKSTLEERTRALALDPLDPGQAWTLAGEWTFLNRLETTVHEAQTALKTA